MMIAETFGRRLKGLREEKSMSQEKLADALEVSRASIGYYEGANRIPDIEFLERTAAYFDVSYDYLMGKSESHKRENIDIEQRLGLSDRMIANIEKLHKNKDSKDAPVLGERYRFRWDVLDQLLNTNGLAKISAFIHGTRDMPDNFIVVSVRSGDRNQWCDMKVDEMLSKRPIGSAEKEFPGKIYYALDYNKIKSILMEDVIEVFDEIRATLIPDAPPEKQGTKYIEVKPE